MSTFEENIANLRQNNLSSSNQIKTYHRDVARYESAAFQRQAELFVLAGNLGSEIVQKISDNRKKDKENEFYSNLTYEGQKEWEQSEAAAAAEEKFRRENNLENKKKKVYNEAERLAGGSELSIAKHKAKRMGGQIDEMEQKNNLVRIKDQYEAYINDEQVTNDGFFFATIPGIKDPKQITVNNPDLTYNEKKAVLNYLTREFLKKHDIQKYSDDLLRLPKERGGSGFMMSIIEQRAQILEEIKKAHKIELSEYEIRQATTQFANVKTNESFQTLITSIKSGYNNEGKQLNWFGVWKRLNEEILPNMIDAYKLEATEILEMGKNITLTINGQTKTLAAHRSLEWGENGVWHRRALGALDQKAEQIKKNNDAKFETAKKNAIDLFLKDELSKADLELARLELVKLDANGSGDNDFTDIDAYIQSDYTQAEADDIAREILNNWKKKSEGLRLEELLKSKDIRVRNSSILTQAIAEDKDIWDIVDDGINQMKRNYFDLETTEQGADVWVLKSSNHYRKWKAIEGYAVRYFKQNKGKSVADVWDATKAWEEKQGGDEKIGTPYDKWESRELDLKTKADNVKLAPAKRQEAKEDLAEFQRKKVLRFVQDANGNYPNLTPQVTNIEIAKEDQKELEAAKRKEKEKTAEAKFTNPDEVIPEELAAFKNEDINYNIMLDKKGYIDDSIVDIAAEHGLTTTEYINYRQKANGKEPLKPEYAKYLNEIELSTLPSAMKKRLLGKINDGQYTPEYQAAEWNNYSKLAGSAIINGFQSKGEDWIQALDTAFNLNLNDEGEWNGTNYEEGKTLIGVYSAALMSLNPTALNDFVSGGTSLFVDALKENLDEESIAKMTLNPEFAFNAYGASGNINFLPVVDSLQATKGQDNINKIMQQLYKIWQTEKPEEKTISESFIPDQINKDMKEISGTDIIEETL